MRLYVNKLLSAALATFLLAACGVKDEPHYKAPKTYDKKTGDSELGGGGESPLPEQDPFTEESSEQTNESETREPARGGEKPEVKKPEETTKPAGEEGEESGEEFEVPGSESEGDEKPKITPDTWIADYQFKGYFDMSELYLLSDGDRYDGYATRIPGTMTSVISYIKNYMIPAPEFISMQATFGDGGSESVVQQQIISPLSDYTSGYTGSDSQSGWQKMHRVTTYENCPAPFVCIDRMEFTPVNRAEGYTFCYIDPSTKKRVAIPYAPAPNNSYDAFKEYFGRGYGPYHALKYAGTDVDCDKPGVAPMAPPFPFYMVIAEGQNNLGPLDFKYHRYQRLNSDFEVIIDVRKRQDHRSPGLNRRPYVDEGARLQQRTSFAINSERGVILKMTKYVRTPISLRAKSTFTDAFASARDTVAATLLPEAVFEYFYGRKKHEPPVTTPLVKSKYDYDGLWIQYHMEFCQNRKAPNTINHCDPAAN